MVDNNLNRLEKFFIEEAKINFFSARSRLFDECNDWLISKAEGRK